ncbi:sialic acid-binding Ig-like lectin 8 [Xenopus laevis]|uniref:Sialic acid-binding Ig-like lectin 8 n=1 Tax=Xenopus laevis TaxID=8355 RepID=A0A8J0TA17_XENLA|nr:sialic acid-binding Ig-like lectin 8 [Xenopus laevis]
MGVRRYWFYWKYHILLAILLLHWKGRNCEEKTEALPGFKIEAPAEVTVQRGLCVLIPCNFTVGSDFTLTKDAIGIWYKGSDKGPVAASTNASQFPDTTNRRFIFTGKVSAGDCSFSISDAQPGDAAHYQFRLEGPLQFNYLHIKPKVSVTDLKEPDISPTIDLIAGEEVTVTCTAPTHCPGLSPTFTWEGSVNTENTQNNTLRHQDRNFPYRSTITFTPSLRHHNSSLTCTVTYKHESAKKSITLNVEYLPILNITVPGGTGEINSLIVREGDSQEIYCKVNSNPMAKISWTKGNSRVENIKQNGQKLTLLLKNVTENNTDTYTCTAQNQRGNNNRSISVSVEYATRQPTICVDKPEGCSTLVNVTEGSTLSLNCSAKSNPPAKYSWFQSDPFKKLSENKTLNVHVTNDIKYTCQAENKYGLSNSSISIYTTRAQKSQANFLVSGLCILFITLVVITTVFVFRWMRKKNDLQEDRITKEKPKSDGDVIYNNMQNISNESYMDTEETKQNKDDSDLYMNCEKELQYASIDFSKVKPKEAPQTVDITYSENIIYSEVKRN